MLRFIILVIYLGLFAFLQQYVRQHPPKLSSKYVDPEARPAIALFWLYGPSLLPLMGLLWSGIIPSDSAKLLGVLPVAPLLLLLIALCIPVIMFLIFFIWLGTFPLSAVSSYLVIAAGGLFFTSVVLVFMQVSPLLLILFYISLVLPPLITIFFMLLWVPEIVPVAPEQSKDYRNILSYFIGFFTTFPKPTLEVVKGKVETRIKGNPFHGAGPGLVITEPHNVVAIKDSSTIRDIKGPGPIFTGNNEQVHSVIDLLQQNRGTKITALTRNGIEVRLPISSVFRINPGSKPLKLDEPWPYRKSDAYKAAFSAEVNPEGKTPLDAHQTLPWESLSLNVAIHKLKQVVSRYSLNELYNPAEDENSSLPRKNIGKEVKQHVIAEMQSKGIKIDGGSVGNTIVPVDEKIIKQRIENWKAKWIRQIMENAGHASAERIRQESRVRAAVRTELLQGLIDQSQKLQNASGNATSALITLQLLETLEHLAQDPKVKPLLPESAIPTFKGLRLQLSQSEEE